MYDYKCDVKLKVEKETFKAHRHVLADARVTTSMRCSAMTCERKNRMWLNCSKSRRVDSRLWWSTSTMAMWRSAPKTLKISLRQLAFFTLSGWFTFAVIFWSAICPWRTTILSYTWQISITLVTFVPPSSILSATGLSCSQRTQSLCCFRMKSCTSCCWKTTTSMPQRRSSCRPFWSGSSMILKVEQSTRRHCCSSFGILCLRKKSWSTYRTTWWISLNWRNWLRMPRNITPTLVASAWWSLMALKSVARKMSLFSSQP